MAPACGNVCVSWLQVKSDILDWHGDHPHTNFHTMFDALVDAGFFLEVLGSPLTCFDAMQVRAMHRSLRWLVACPVACAPQVVYTCCCQTSSCMVESMRSHTQTSSCF